MINRQTIIPLVFGALICLLAVTFVSHGIAINEFNWAVPTRSLKLENMPQITALFRKADQFWWFLPACAAIGAALLVRRPSCQSKHLAWFLSITGIAAVLWGLLCALAIYLVKGTFVCGT